MKHLNQNNFDTHIQDGIALIDFYASRCGPCKVVAKLIHRIDEKYGKEVLIAKVDTDQEKQLAARFSVYSLPTILIFHNGKEVERIVGLQPPENYIQALTKYLPA